MILNSQLSYHPLKANQLGGAVRGVIPEKNSNIYYSGYNYNIPPLKE